MSRYREMPDGSIVFPRRGGTPENPDPHVWTRDSKDEYHFFIALPLCILRESYTHILPCGRQTTKLRCKLGLEVSPTSCGLCDERKEQ